MNIFVTSPDPVESARYLDDRRLVKMVLESTQLLYTAVKTLGLDCTSAPNGGSSKTGHSVNGYRTTHLNHPCSVWARESGHSYFWLCAHTEALMLEYTARFGKVHKCQEHLPFLKAAPRDLFQWQDSPPPFRNCTTNHKHIPDIHEAYRMEMAHKWYSDCLAGRPPKWT